MQPRRSTVDRLPCRWHGLVVNDDGACPLCAVDDRLAGRARSLKAMLVVASVGAALAIPLSWLLARPHVTTADDVVPTAPLEDRVRLAQAPAEQAREPVAPSPTPSPPQALLPKNPAALEDLRLGEATLLPPTGRPAPPAPPRALVDPEPQAADDPQDFDLPGQ